MSLATLTATDHPASAVATTPRRAKSPKGTRATSRQVDAKPKKVSFYLSEAAIKRLGVHAAMESTDKSRLVEALILDGLKRFVVSDRAKADGREDSAMVEGSAN